MKRNLIFTILTYKPTPYLACLLLIGILCMPTVEVFSADVLDPDLVLYFDYEDFKGDTVVEKSGRGYDGAINGKVTQSNDGKFGKAAHFVAGSFLDLDGPNVKPEDIPTEGMSIVAWINVEAISQIWQFSTLAQAIALGLYIQRHAGRETIVGSIGVLAARLSLTFAVEITRRINGSITLVRSAAPMG